jgi:hypothetical protein
MTHGVVDESFELDDCAIGTLGVWDIAALFVPNFGNIQPFVWNHIIVGLILMIVGVLAARHPPQRG